jgi:hypothetical protein
MQQGLHGRRPFRGGQGRRVVDVEFGQRRIERNQSAFEDLPEQRADEGFADGVDHNRPGLVSERQDRFSGPRHPQRVHAEPLDERVDPVHPGGSVAVAIRATRAW